MLRSAECPRAKANAWPLPSRLVQCTVVPTLTDTTCGPKAKLWIVTESAATGACVGAAAEEGIPLMLMPDGIAVGSTDGVADVPLNPARC